MIINRNLFIVFGLLLLVGCSAASRMQTVRVSADKKGFVLSPSGERFVPWGHNYAAGGLEESGKIDWTKVAAEFEDFNHMGANVARVHLQVPHFMAGPNRFKAEALEELKQLL